MMLKRLTAVTARIALASLVMMVSAWPALAQTEEQAGEAAPESGAWKALALAIFFMIAIGIGCFMSPKRTHQD